jgi:serine/threonine protein kinase
MCTNHKTNNQLYLIDYGLAVNYTVIHDAKLEFKGTPYFASNNMLMRGNLGPRDDIEALMYLMLYLLNGKLPWSQNLPVMSDEPSNHNELQRVIHQHRDP